MAQVADLLDERAVAVEEDGAASKHLPHRADHAVDADAPHASMIDGTLAHHARPAPDGCVSTACRSPAGRVRRSSVGPKTAVTRDAEGCAEVHRARSRSTRAPGTRRGCPRGSANRSP